jgi:predicted metalloprotease
MRPATGLKIGGGGTLLFLLIMLLLGGDPGALLSMFTGASAPVEDYSPAPTGAADDEAGEFVERILGDTEDAWTAQFASLGMSYSPATLVMFTGAVQSACGVNSSAVGPFYCPLDQRVYIDLSFYRELQRFGAPGDFAQAYVIAHEVGHHVQNLLGISDEVRSLQQRASEAQANALSVRMELQADCYAGIWGHSAAASGLLEAGDVEEGLRAAAAIGDDRLQRQAGRRVNPEAFTHGTSEQRSRWFNTGLQSGDIQRCDTFSASNL